MRNWMALCEGAQDWTHNIRQAAEYADMGFFFEEGGCFGMALALHDAFTAAGQSPQYALMDDLTHAFVIVDQQAYDWSGAVSLRGRIVTRREMLRAALNAGWSKNELSSSYRDAAEVIETAKELNA